MRNILFVTLSLLSLRSFAAEPISPWHCPAEIELNEELVHQNVELWLAKGDLVSAAELASSCGNWGSSQTARVIAPVVDRFWKKLNAVLPGKEQTQMEKLMRKCSSKYKDEGTLGMALNAHCQLRVVRAYYGVYID